MSLASAIVDQHTSFGRRLNCEQISVSGVAGSVIPWLNSRKTTTLRQDAECAVYDWLWSYPEEMLAKRQRGELDIFLSYVLGIRISRGVYQDRR